MLVSGYLSAQFAGVQRGDGNEWLAVNDIVRYASLALCVRRSGFSARQATWVISMIVISCTIAAIEGFWYLKVSGIRDTLQLVSVGHVNHSAIYMAICSSVAAGLMLAFWRGAGRGAKGAMIASTGLLLTGLFIGGSRAAAAVGVLLLLFFGAIGARAAGFGRAIWALLLPMILVAILVGGQAAIKRQLEYASKNYWMSHRDLIWNRGLVGWRQHPVFGIGMDNYSQITDARLQAWLAEQGRPYVAEAYSPAPHAHSLFVNTLVERGLIGLATLLALLAAWFANLLQRRPTFSGGGSAVALWCASFSALAVSVTIGLFNTTFHHEHAMLAVLCLALWLDGDRQRT
jgi:O-antigen ligase